MNTLETKALEIIIGKIASAASTVKNVSGLRSTENCKKPTYIRVEESLFDSLKNAKEKLEESLSWSRALLKQESNEDSPEDMNDLG